MSGTLESARIKLAGPVDVPGSFERFTRWGDDLLDRWDGQVLVRTVLQGDGSVTPVAIEPSGTVKAPALEATSESLAAITEPLESMIVTAHAPLARLAAEDPAIGAIAAVAAPRRPILSLDPFAHLIASITAQQVNMRWAVTLRRRLVDAYGQTLTVDGLAVSWLDPERIARVEQTELREMQFSGRKAEYIVGLAQAIAEGELSLLGLRDLEDDEVMARITAIRGLGRWTAEWYLVRVLGRPHVVAGDLAVRKVIGSLYLSGEVPTEDEARGLTAHWGDAAVVAQQLALEHLYS